MTISEAEAAAAVRSFMAKTSVESTQIEIVSIKRSELEGRDCWAVETREPLEPGEPDWFRLYDPPEIYFIDAVSGQCIASRGRTFKRFQFGTPD